MRPQRARLVSLIDTARRPPSVEAVAADPFCALSHAHIVEERLCDLLEAIADALPAQPHGCSMRIAARLLVLRVAADLALCERLVLPVLADACRHRPVLKQACALARAAQSIDEGVAIELAEMLIRQAEAGSRAGTEVLGYLIRVFTESRRREIAWEETVLFPMAGPCLDPDARARLGKTLNDARENLGLSPRQWPRGGNGRARVSCAAPRA